MVGICHGGNKLGNHDDRGELRTFGWRLSMMKMMMIIIDDDDDDDGNDGGLRTWLAALHPPPTWNSGHVQLPSKHSKYSSLRRRAGKRI